MGPPGCDEDDETYAVPRLVKLFVNMGDVDFTDIDDADPSQQYTNEKDGETEAVISCKGHKFQRLESLQIFIQEAMCEEATRTFVNRVSVVGHQAQSYHAE